MVCQTRVIIYLSPSLDYPVGLYGRVEGGPDPPSLVARYQRAHHKALGIGEPTNCSAP